MHDILHEPGQHLVEETGAVVACYAAAPCLRARRGMQSVAGCERLLPVANGIYATMEPWMSRSFNFFVR